MASKRLSVMDASFVQGESGATMMHVAGMNTYRMPETDPVAFMRRIAEEVRSGLTVQAPWNWRLRNPELLRSPVHHWVEEDAVDLEYHVRRSGLPTPGDERELGTLVSRLHSYPVDFHRPPWDMHWIEGLEGGRIATYTKMHHALVDGATGSKILARSLSEDPNDLDTPLFFTLPPPERRKKENPAADSPSLASVLAMTTEQVRRQMGAGRDVGKGLLNVLQAARGRDDLVIPFKAPKSILNGRISRSRRFATQQFEIARLKAVAKRADATLNDIVLALCATSLRRFLLDLGELPNKPLISMIPVDIRPKDDPGGGNAVGIMLASLGTDIGDPEQRLRTILESTRRAKQQLQGMSREAIMQYSMLIMAPFSLQMLTGTSGRFRPPFNLVISNVPGPEKKLYFRGAELEAVYPVSIPLHGQAFNITCQSYAGTLNFGFVGCRNSLPHLQHLAVYTREALEELEKLL